MSRKGQLTLFFIISIGAMLFVTLILFKAINVSSVLEVKKTITLSNDLSDQGTGAIAFLNREHQGKKYITVLGESTIEGYASQPQEAYASLKRTMEIMGENFYINFKEKPVDVARNIPTQPQEKGECGLSGKNLGITLAWPSESTRVTSGFGYRNSPRPCYCHSGVDIATGGGKHDEVFAVYDGKVVYFHDQCKESPNCFQSPNDDNCKCNQGFGNRIMIKHVAPNGEEFFSHYYHLSEIFVSTGDTVNAGQRIAMTGNTGRSEAPHLHFELADDVGLSDSVAMDPCIYFANAPEKCRQADVKSCSVLAGRSGYTLDIPLPGAEGDIKGVIEVNKWQN